MKNLRFILLFLVSCLVINDGKASDNNTLWAAVLGSVAITGWALKDVVAHVLNGSWDRNYPTLTDEVTIKAQESSILASNAAERQSDRQAVSNDIQVRTQWAALLKEKLALTSHIKNPKERAIKKAQIEKTINNLDGVVSIYYKELDRIKHQKEVAKRRAIEKYKKMSKEEKEDKTQEEFIWEQLEEIKDPEFPLEELSSQELKKIEDKYRKKDDISKPGFFAKLATAIALAQSTSGNCADFLARYSFAPITDLGCFKDTFIQAHAKNINRALVATTIVGLGFGLYKLYDKYTNADDDEYDNDKDDDDDK